MRRKICGYCSHLRRRRRRVRLKCKTAGAAVFASARRQGLPFSLLQGGRRRRLLRICKPASVTVCPASVSYPNARPVCLCPRKTFLRALTKRGIAKSNMGKMAVFCRESKKTVCERFSREPFLEAPPGFEPGSQGFADPCLTTWLWRRFPFFREIKNSAEIVFGAGNETRTRDIHLGKVTLYH